MEESKFYRFIKPLIPKPLRPAALRHQEILIYLIFGVLTTLVDFAVYYPLEPHTGYLAANIAAWAVAVVFAFFVNKAFVFEDGRWDAGSLLRQAGGFVASRLFSLGAAELTLFLLVERLSLGPGLSKVLAQTLVVVLNYFFGKFLVFRRK